jgi:hypothetical protein
MQSTPPDTKAKAKKIEGMKKLREAYLAAQAAGTIKKFHVQQLDDKKYDIQPID